MKNSKRLNKIVEALVDASFDKNSNLIEEKVRSFTKFLASLPYSEAIGTLSDYYKRIKFQIDKTTLVIESPIAISSDQAEKIEDFFGRKHQINKVVLEINPSLLGGVRVKIGDMVYDNSVKGRINQLKEVVNG